MNIFEISKVSNNRIIIYNPYRYDGGGGEIQSKFQKIIDMCFRNVDIRLISSGNKYHGIKLYIHRLNYVISRLNGLADSKLIIIQSILDPGSLILGYYALRHKVPYIIVPRGDFIPTREFIFITQHFFIKWSSWLLLGRKLISNAAAVVVTSELERTRLIKVFARKNNIHIIPDSTYEGIISEDKETWTITENLKTLVQKPFALWFGRIAKEKGIDLLLECWPHVLKRCPDAMLLLAGPVTHGNIYRRLLEQRNILNLERSVYFLDWIAGDEKKYLLLRARCLLLPSHYESFGIVVVEALSAQTPVVVSLGTPWRSLNKSAGYCLPRDKHLWVNAILSYLSPPNKLIVSSDEVNNMMKPYSVLAIYNQWNHLFDRIVRNHE